MEDAQEIIEEVPVEEIQQSIDEHLLLVALLVIGLVVLWVFARRITHWMMRRAWLAANDHSRLPSTCRSPTRRTSRVRA